MFTKLKGAFMFECLKVNACIGDSTQCPRDNSLNKAVYRTPSPVLVDGYPIPYCVRICQSLV